MARWGRLVRGGAGTALVGSAETVAARMLEYRELGIETFILSGYPPLEEPFGSRNCFSPDCLLCTTRGTAATGRGPFFSGEIVGNDLLPKSPLEAPQGKC